MLSRRSMLKWVAGIATGFGLGGAAKCANAAELREAPLSNPLPDFPKFNLADKLIAGQYESIGYGVFYFTLEEAVIVSFPNDEHAISMFVEAGEACRRPGHTLTCCRGMWTSSALRRKARTLCATSAATA
jgi:hypothetical protein